MPRQTVIACFGEILIRLSAPNNELLLQTPALNVSVAGAEANVAVSLKLLGAHARLVSIVPDNALADFAIRELRKHSVELQVNRVALGRMGLLFLTTGVGARASEVLYDRSQSSFALAPPDAIDWPQSLSGVDWLHISGVTAAVSANAFEAALAAARAAQQSGVRVSIDANFRPTLWKARREDPQVPLRRLFSEANLLFANTLDLALVLGKHVESKNAAARAAFDCFPTLERLAFTERVTHSASHCSLTGWTFTRSTEACSRSHDIPGIVDRVGAGDAFAAAALLTHAQGRPDSAILEFAMAAAVLKHYIPGDFNLATREAIEAYVAGASADVRR